MTKHGRAGLLFAAAAAVSAGLSGQAQAQLYWDTNGDTAGASGDGTPLTAPGTWDATTLNWSTSADGTVTTQAWTAGQIATFSAGTHVTSSSTITVSDTQSIGGLNFEEGNLILNTGTLSLTGTPTFNVASGALATINGPITGSPRWTKTGPGTISVRAGSNSNTGGVTINQGTVVIGNGNVDTQLGTAPGSAVSDHLIFNGGTLRTANTSGTTMNATRGVRLDSNGGTFDIDGGGTGTWTIAGIISGTGRLTKTGENILVLSSANNTFSGGVTINESTVSVLTDSTSVGAAARLGAVPSSPDADNLLFDGGTLRSTNGSAWVLHANRGITINSGGATFDNTAVGTVSVAGTVTGTGTITKQLGSGVTPNLLLFSANNSGTYTGRFVVTSGSIQSNNPANSGEAGFGDQPDSFVADGITLNGGGLRVGPNSYTIHANRGITLGSNGGTLDTANVGSSITIDSVISGVGSLTKVDADGVATLRGVNTYTGNTILTAGLLTLADDAGLKFVIGAGGVNNQVTGPAAGIVILDGDFTFDLSSAAANLGDSWSIVDLLNKSYGSTFTVVGFDESSDVWTQAISPSLAYQFTESSGILQVVAVPEPAALALLGLGGALLARRGRRRP